MELLDQIKAEVEAGNVSEYNEFTATLAEYKSEVPDASTSKGYERAKEVAGVLTKTRTAIEAKRKEYKAPVLALGKLIDGKAKDITEEIKEVETPFKEAYRAVDEEKKRLKAELEKRIQDIKDLPLIASEKKSEEIDLMISELAEIDVSKETFGRRVDEVSELVAYTLERLTEVQAKVIEQELEAVRIEAERAELEKLRQEQAEREQAQREAAEKAEREAEEARIAEEAAEKARLEAERKAKDELERVEREKAEAIEREKAAEKARIEAEEKAKIEAEAAAERARIEEQQRQKSEADRIKREQEQREANNRHVGSVRRQSKEDLMKLGLDEDTAKKVVMAIHNKEVRNIGISY